MPSSAPGTARQYSSAREAVYRVVCGDQRLYAVAEQSVYQSGLYAVPHRDAFTHSHPVCCRPHILRFVCTRSPPTPPPPPAFPHGATPRATTLPALRCAFAFTFTHAYAFAGLRVDLPHTRLQFANRLLRNACCNARTLLLAICSYRDSVVAYMRAYDAMFDIRVKRRAATYANKHNREPHFSNARLPVPFKQRTNTGRIAAGRGHRRGGRRRCVAPCDTRTSAIDILYAPPCLRAGIPTATCLTCHTMPQSVSIALLSRAPACHRAL